MFFNFNFFFFNNFYRRRSPKNKQGPLIPNLEVEPDKLSQEAYRLLRTVQNLMNTQEPSLLHSIPTTIDNVNTKNDDFNRKHHSRESRLSIRSSTDDSVHSNSSSSKNETDEDNTDRPSPILSIPPHPVVVHHATTQGVSNGVIIGLLDDESGFSSMNSFQDIGLPLVNSTMRSTSISTASSTSSDSTELENATTIENKNTTLIARDHNSIIGVPRVAHRRWDSAPVVQGRLQLSSDDTLRVLWV